MNKIELAKLDQVGRGATIKIAASNATEKSKAAADYVCDGVADNVEINAAIAELDGIGGCVELSEGTFTFGTDLTLTDRIWLKGQGKATIIINTDKWINIAANANVTISDLVLDEGYGISNEGTVDIFNSIVTGLNNSKIAKIYNCKANGVSNMFGDELLLIGNEINGVDTNDNIFPNTIDLLKQINKITTVAFE